MADRLALILALSLCSLACRAGLGIEGYSTNEFNPSQGKNFVIPVKTTQSGSIQVNIYSPDGDLVRALPIQKSKSPGVHQFVWDGKDNSGQVVPNEAYIPVVSLTPQGEPVPVVYDPRSTSGGETISIRPETVANKQIVFNLEKPSRILARAGIKSGPMMKSILNWGVRGAGRNMLLWNGYDNDDLKNLYSHPDFNLVVTGFEIPNHSIITVGNSDINYRSWREEKNWTSTMPDFKNSIFERNGRRISNHYYLPRSVDIDPKVSLKILDSLSLNKLGNPIVKGPVTLRVNMDQKDQWAMQQSLYEVAFFINYQFVSEEEQGYVPLSWRWDPAGLEAGLHLITVNVSGFNGQVGVRSLQIEIPE